MLHSKINIKNHATAGEKKAMPLAHKHSGHMKSANIPGNYRFHPESAGKTRQDLGNFTTQVIRSK